MKLFLASALLICASFYGFAQADFSKEVEQIISRSTEKGFENPVVFVGSSSIRMWKSLEQDFPKFQVLNHGFGGSEYSDLIRWQEELVGEFEPSMVIIYAGDNDLANNEEPTEIGEEADLFVDGLRRLASGAPVIIISAKPSLSRWKLKDKYIELNKELKRVADQYEHAVFVDVWAPMLDVNGEPNKTLFIEDGLHMNDKGYEIWRNALRPFLSK